MSSDPDRSISFQLSDMFSFINKPSGAIAPWSLGTQGTGEEHTNQVNRAPPSTAIRREPSWAGKS